MLEVITSERGLATETGVKKWGGLCRGGLLSWNAGVA